MVVNYECQHYETLTPPDVLEGFFICLTHVADCSSIVVGFQV
jgi:hypothetical protein